MKRPSIPLLCILVKLLDLLLPVIALCALWYVIRVCSSQSAIETGVRTSVAMVLTLVDILLSIVVNWGDVQGQWD